MADTARTTKPNVLVLGGVGFIGRNVVHYLVTNDLANKVRVVDKVMPGMAWLNPTHKEAFSKVEFKHANLINAKSVANAFSSPDGVTFDLVINCAGETKYGHGEAVYRDGIYKLSMNCANEAARHRARRYVEVSSAHMLTTDKKPMTEDMNCEPWTMCARLKYAVERELGRIPDLDFVVVRPAIVYGLGDKLGLTPRLVIGGVYKHLGEKMKMLWTKDVKMCTVHVRDVARAIWHVCNHGNHGEIYNLADKGFTSQGDIGEMVSELLNINYDFMGTMFSNMAKLTAADLVEDVNEKHMAPWGEVCLQEGILTTPLNPHLSEEQLTDKNLHVDGSKIEKTGFQYEHPRLTPSLLKEVLDDYVSQKLFPASLLTLQ